MRRLIIVALFALASIMAPVQAQWAEAYYNSGAFYGFHFTDSLNGWFSHIGSQKIIHTSDGGYTFDVQLNVALSFNMYDVYMEDNLNGWACGSNTGYGPGYIYRTTNGGADWVQKTHPASQSIWGQIEQVGSSIWFFGSYAGATEYMLIMKTSDGGNTWQLNQYPQIVGAAGIYIFDSLNFIVHGVGGLLARTTDGGNSWISTTLPSDYQVERVKFLDTSIGYALVSNVWSNTADAYLYRTSDGGFTWNLHYSWIDQGQKQGLSIIPGINTIFVGGWLSGTPPYLFGITKSTDLGASWNIVSLSEYAPTNMATPDIYHGWASVGPHIYRYDYVVPPTVEPIPNQLTQLGELFSYQVEATGTGLKYTMSGEPAGLSIGYYSGLIQGTPTEGGNFPVTVAVRDTDANVVNAQFNLRVNRKPIFLPPFPPTHAWVDSVYQFTLSVEDADDDTVDFVWLSKPDWLTFLTAGITSVVISGVPTINDTGDTDISVMASDNYGGYDTLSWMLHVELYVPGNNAPYFIPPWPDTLAYVDSLYDVMLYAEDIDGDSLYFSWLAKPSWLAMLDVMGTARIQGTPAISDTGYHPVSVMVDDNRGGSDTLNWTIQVINIPPPVNNLPQFVGSWPDTLVVYRDSTYNWDFLFQDIDGDTLFTIPGDIGVPGLTLLPGSGVGEVTAIVTGSPTDTGWYTALVSVKDEHGALGTLQFVVHVDFVTSVEPLPGIPTAYSLAQNYPNPFNPVTTIEYSLPHAGVVELKIYNLLGQEVEVLVNNEYQPIGVYEVSFDASILPSGIYFYRLQAGSYTQTQKMVLQK